MKSTESWHGSLIFPKNQSIRKEITAVFDSIYESDYVTVDKVTESEAPYESVNNIDTLITDLEKEMKDAAKELAFEKAAVLRDQIAELKKLLLFEI